MHVRSLLAGAAVAALALPGTIAAEGDATVATAAFERLDVRVEAGVVVVEGVASYGGETVVVGEDATTDAAPAGFGLDLSRAEVSQDPDSGDVVFRLVLADMVAGATANTWVWSWPIGGSSLSEPQLLAFSSDPSGAPGSFQFGVGTGGGVNEDFAIADVQGEFDGEALVWRVPPSALGIDEGSKISPGAAVRSTSGSRNAAFYAVMGNSFDDMPVTEKFGIGGGATITILDADGEEVDEVDARVRRGEFSASIADLEPGSYSIVVTTVYGDAEASQVFTVVI